MDIFLEKEVKKVKVVKDNKRYWFIRTYAGEAFPFYLEENYVGLGLNMVPLRYINEADVDDETTFNTLHNFITKNTDYKLGEATKWAKQLISFTKEMSIGDTVIMPSKSSEKLAFGTITSDVFLQKNPGKINHRGVEESLPEKRRSVKWNEVIPRSELQGELRGMLSSHQGITNADEYGYIIEGAQESIFIKNEAMYLVLEVGADEDINAFELQRFLHGLTYFYKEFCKDNGIEDNEELYIKIRLQSKGRAYLKGLFYGGVVGLLGLVLICNHPKVKFKTEIIEFEAESDGGLKSVSDFLDRNQERKFEMIKLKDSMDQLKANKNKNTSLLNEELKKDSSNGIEKGRKKK